MNNIEIMQRIWDIDRELDKGLQDAKEIEKLKQEKSDLVIEYTKLNCNRHEKGTL